MGYSIRTPTHRMIEWREFETGKVTARELYYHLENSPESINLIDEASPELVDEIAALLASTHPPKKLTMAPAIHSSPSPGRLPADISFSNKSSTQISIYPITTKGKRARARRLEPNEEVTISARIGGAFVVESINGKIHEVHSPSFPPRVIEIR